MTATRSTWTPAMLARLRTGLARGEKRKDIAAALGISPEAVNDKARYLKRAGRLNVVRKFCSKCSVRFVPDMPQDRRCRHCRSAADVRRSVCVSCGGPCATKASRCGACHHARQGDGEAGTILPEREGEPTSVLPGPAKVEILAARYLAGQLLWHELDARRDS